MLWSTRIAVIWCFFCVVLAVPALGSTFSPEAFVESIEAFEAGREERTEKDRPDYSAVFAKESKGETVARYVDIRDVYPTQVRYSLSNIKQNASKSEAGDLAHDGRRSLYPKSKFELVVIGPGRKLYILDGHHGTMVCIFRGCKSIPVRIVADFSQYEQRAFWSELVKKRWAFLITLHGDWHMPNGWNELEDDQFRYIIKLIGGAILSEKGQFKTYVGAPYPAWVKENDGAPFVEFRLGDALREHMVADAFRLAKADSVVKNAALIERARAVFADLSRGGHPAFLQVYIPPKRMNSDEIVREFLKDDHW